MREGKRQLSLAFVVERTPEFRYLGPVIDAAMEAGHAVSLLLDQSQPSSGPKGYQFPSMSSVPRFRHGTPSLVSYLGPDGLLEHLRSGGLDGIVASRGPTHYFRGTKPGGLPAWTSVQEHLDFVAFGLDRITSSDLNCVYSPHWLDVAARLYGVSDEELRKQLEATSVCVGSCQSDGLALVDPEETRRRWSIPADKPVVVYIPSNRASDLYFRAIHAPNVLLRAAYVALARRWRLLRPWLGVFSDRMMVRAVRQFCDKNGAFLLVKTRQKNPLPAYLHAAADRIVADETEYPAGILAPLSVASLCIASYLSDTVLDAAAAGVPFFAFHADSDDWPLSAPDVGLKGTFADAFYNLDAGGAYNYPGVSYSMPLVEAVRSLPSKALDNFPLDTRALSAYVSRYLGYADGRCSERVVDAMEQRIGTASRR